MVVERDAECTCVCFSWFKACLLRNVWCASVWWMHVSCESGEPVNTVHIVQLSKWLLCVYKSMDEFADNAATLAELKSLRMIPLTSGRVTSACTDTVFFPLASSAEKRGCCLQLLIFLLHAFEYVGRNSAHSLLIFSFRESDISEAFSHWCWGLTSTYP